MKATNHTITTLVTLVLMLLLGQGALTSCRDKQHIKSLSEMLRDEKKMIDNFIEEQEMNVQEGVEEQREFDPNVWYKFPNGVYMQVIDKGGELAKPERTRVMLRMKGRLDVYKRQPHRSASSCQKVHEASVRRCDGACSRVAQRGSSSALPPQVSQAVPHR